MTYPNYCNTNITYRFSELLLSGYQSNYLEDYSHLYHSFLSSHHLSMLNKCYCYLGCGLSWTLTNRTVPRVLHRTLVRAVEARGPARFALWQSQSGTGIMTGHRGSDADPSLKQSQEWEVIRQAGSTTI